ncbi:ParB N-terminal domain-containing protein [Mycobacterium sp. 852002-40037_SCH5390672]|uniref:ParB N-terminal domain-containing protein n=1 Tax=Mycobacterium sp. 852002-40037_SCH5390672 TaxID=1834089 RepID=UPI0009EE0C86|nr:ParB N-terminal domain-containing protein [Mycobacterium sp. 852002-40037_SCH5390672]
MHALELVDEAEAPHFSTPAGDGVTHLRKLMGDLASVPDTSELHTFQSQPTNRFALAVVRISDLRTTGSPRLSGIDSAHVCRLTEAPGPLPPIVVHRESMQLIDGFHRVAAAVQMGLRELQAYMFDGPADLAFILSVGANVTHGLPLQLADRRAAAAKILATHPQLSDRAIASVAGLSGKTVAAIRGATGEDAQLHERLGKDGRVRPLNTAAGRQMAAQLIEENPGASLRQIAAAAGLSPGTVRDVRARLARGEGPLPTQSDKRLPAAAAAKKRWPPMVEAADVTPLLQTLSKDPALRMTVAGRQLLRWFHQHVVGAFDSMKVAEAAPDHCVDHLVELATRCSMNWARLAENLENRRAMLAEGRDDAEMGLVAEGDPCTV